MLGIVRICGIPNIPLTSQILIVFRFMLVSFASWGLLAWRVLGWLWVDGDFVREWRFFFSFLRLLACLVDGVKAKVEEVE